jgi:hypothetical protein
LGSKAQVALHRADAMLGADRAGKFLDDIVHRQLHLIPLRQEFFIPAR